MEPRGADAIVNDNGSAYTSFLEPCIELLIFDDSAVCNYEHVLSFPASYCGLCKLHHCAFFRALDVVTKIAPFVQRVGLK